MLYIWILNKARQTTRAVVVIYEMSHLLVNCFQMSQHAKDKNKVGTFEHDMNTPSNNQTVVGMLK